MERKIETESLGAQPATIGFQEWPLIARQPLIWIMALSVAFSGYLSCLISSQIHWQLGWITPAAVLPGLSFGLVTGGWLLYRSWISIGRAVGFAIGSTLGYFAAYWTAFYTLAFCGTGMVLSELRLPLFHVGMIGGAVGTTLLTASFAAVSADFRRKNWKRLIIIGTAAGGALLLAGIGAKGTDHEGTLVNPGDRLFIFLWQLLVSSYITTLFFSSQSSPASGSARGSKIAQWTTRAVVTLLMLSVVHAAIGFWRGGKKSLLEEQKANQQAFLTTAGQAFEQSDWPRAIEDYSAAIALGQNDPRTYFNRGQAREKLGEHKGAIEDFTKAIEASRKTKNTAAFSTSDVAAAFNNRALCHTELNEYAVAVEDYTRAIELAPNEAVLYSNRAAAYDALGHKLSAESDRTKAQALAEKGRH